MIAQLLTKLLRNIADRIDSGNSNMTDEELLSALETLEHMILQHDFQKISLVVF